MAKWFAFFSRTAKSGKGGKASKPSRPGRVRKEESEGFWDKPALLNLTSDMLMLGGFVGLAWAAALMVQRLPLFPLKQVVVQGQMSQITRGQLESQARSVVNGNFFTVNVDGVRLAFEKLPWVRRVEVRRRWPDGLELNIEEQVAVARWRDSQGEMRLVNRFGEVFIATSEENMPVFAGPEGAASRILAQHKAFSDTLSTIGRKPVEVVLSSREAWEMKLDDGLVLALGREEATPVVEERLARFVANYRDVGEKLRIKPAMIDMRYPNGFALRATGKTS